MIDFSTALQIAQTILLPLQQAFLQQIGKQAAEALAEKISRLRDLIFSAVTSDQPAEANLKSISETDSSEPEELAARILLAAKKSPDAFRDILTQYHVIKRELEATQSTGDVSAIASGGSTIYQIVNPQGNINLLNPLQSATGSAPPSPAPGCSAAAHELLANAAADGGKIVRSISTGRPPHGGLSINTDTRTFVSDDDPRLRAKWEGALSELVDLGLLSRPSSPQGVIYLVTQKGYDYVDAPAPDNSSRESD